MKFRALTLCIAIATFGGIANAQDAPKKVPATIKIAIPEKPTITEITIEDKKLEEPGNVKDATRVFTTPDLEPGKTYAYKIVGTIIPNNYTKIFRTREITFKAGETISVDLRTEDKVKDKIEVRWVPTPDDIVDKMCELAKVTKEDVIHDYGCGDAVMLIRPIQKLGAKKGLGIELDPKMVAEANKNIKAAKLEDKIVVKKGDILDLKEKDCEEATVVLLYIGDDLGARLGPVLQKALKPGSRVVSHRFTLGDWKPNSTITVTGADGDPYVLHLWIVPERKK